jgi:hypothetical protein
MKGSRSAMPTLMLFHRVATGCLTGKRPARHGAGCCVGTASGTTAILGDGRRLNLDQQLWKGQARHTQEGAGHLVPTDSTPEHIPCL